MITRRQALLNGAAGLGVLLAGAAGVRTLASPQTRAAGTAPVTLQVTYAPANFAPIYDALFKAFMDENPDITVKGRGFASYDELVQYNLRAQITGGLPDVSHEGLNLIRLYADRHAAAPLDGFIARDSEWNAAGYTSAVQRIGSVNGKVYAVPFAVSTPTLFVNRDLVKRAGANPDRLPTDWPEIIELAKAIHALGGNTSGLYFDYKANGAFGFETLLFSRGGTMTSPDEKVLRIDGPEGQWAMEMLRRFGEAGQIDMSRANALQAFVAGTLGIYMNTSSMLGSFEKSIGNRFSYAMVPIPVHQNGHLPAGGNGMVMFSRDDAHREAAWKYIRFASGPKQQAIMAKASGYVPVNSRVLDDPATKAFYEAHPNYAVALGQLKDLTAWYLLPGMNGVKANDALITAMGEVVTLRKSPQQALSDVTAEIQKLIRVG